MSNNKSKSNAVTKQLIKRICLYKGIPQKRTRPTKDLRQVTGTNQEKRD